MATSRTCPFERIQSSMLLLIFWRSWFIRNEIVHHGPAPPMEVSTRFLHNYLDALIGIKLNSRFDPAKGKCGISYDLKPRSAVEHPVNGDTPWRPPQLGWVKLNTDGSYSFAGGAGAGMILRDNSGAIIFSSCRALFSCRSPMGP